MTYSSLTNGIQLTSDSSPRPGGIDRFIIHHAATTSLSAILELFQPGGRTVSANYAMGSDGTLILAVDEDRRAWTSSSAYWDGRAVTIEVANSYAGDPWPVSDASFDNLARLIADVSIRYGFPINDDTVLTHQELYTRYGDSYPTACPGDLQRRKGELLALANHYRSGGAPAGGNTTPIEDKDMSMERLSRDGLLSFVDEFGADSVGNYVTADMGNDEVVGGLNATFGNYKDLGARTHDVVAAIAQRRWDTKKAEIVGGVLTALKPLLEAIKSPEIPVAVLDDALDRALDGISVKAEIDEATKQSLADYVVNEQANRLSNQ